MKAKWIFGLTCVLWRVGQAIHGWCSWKGKAISSSYWLAAICGMWAALSGGWVHAEQCTAVFPGGIQSHSPSGFIQMGYMSRVYGSGSTLNAPIINHTHTWADQYGLCDGVICSATGNHTSTVDVDFQTGSDVPTTFQLSTSNNNVSNGYRAGTLSLSAGDYGTVSAGQESTIRFATANSVYKVKTISTAYKSTVEFQPGIYWVNGNLDWQAQDTRIRRLSGSDGMVTLYVSGNVNIGQAHIEGFSRGQVRLYVQGNVTVGNDFVFPGEIHARGQVSLGMNAVITGGIYSGDFSTGNTATIRYTRANYDHKMGTLNPAYNSTFELSPGNYWIDGGFTADVSSTFRKIGGSGVVRLFVRGDINVQHAASFQGFAGGDLVMYSTGNITLTSQTDLPAFVYAAGDVTINFSRGARYKGGITGRNVYIGQGSIVEYLDPVDLGPLCDDEPSVVAVDHYSLDYSATALTCSSLSVTVRACADAACSSTISTPSTLTLSPSSGWGSNPITFTGSTTATLVVRSPGEVTLGVSSASPAASNGLVCSTSGCKVTFLDSGFLVSVPNMISSRPQSATIAAVRKDGTSQACVPAFANVSRTLNFSTSYQNPSTGTRSITVNGSNSAATLSFNSNGVASVTVNYDDAGQVALNASYSGSGGNSDQGLSMTGSGSFVAKPYGLCITPDTNTCSVAGVSSNCTVLAAAGDSIPIRVRAVGWQGTTVNGVQTGEVLDGEALCTGNVVTSNFQLSNIGLSLSLVEPSEGAVGPNTLPSSYTHVLGEQTTLNGDGGVSFSEVGVFRIAAKTNTEYMGMGHVGGDGTMSGSNAENQNLSRLIGRIVPAYLDVTPNTPLLQPNCVTHSETQAGFSYQGEAISFAVAPMLSITGKNRANGTTRNYDRGDFWRWQSSNFTHTPDFGSNDDSFHDDARLSGNPNFTVDTNDLQLGDGTRDVTIRGQALTYVRNLYAPLASDAAFRPYLALRFPLTDQDGVCYKSADTSAAAVCEPYVLDNLSFPEANSQIRLGRAVLENANGSELAPLGLPLVIESWQGSYFAKTSDDSCTVFPEEPEPELSNYTDNLNAGETTASMEGAGANRFVELTAPGLGNEGSVRVTPTVPELLRYDWDGSGSFQNPSGLATFGIYKGTKPLIFRREVYR